MATSNSPSLKQELRDCNDTLDSYLRSHVGMTLKTYKLIKAVTQLVGAAAGIYAMRLGAPPLAAFALVAIIISGPEALEYLINDAEA
ncbi:hypothetical protein [Halosimplex pelagicum]|uniref:Uncharacterized protein n=2 Tax=Halosimplex TaxID=171163 RepID=A0A7D5T3R8_9EURY|nr:hypothetical protein [Halosimplex pelagicum]QLH80968.1 hypothetical protein HZS54_04655 [Halosimplex pelagicum]